MTTKNWKRLGRKYGTIHLAPESWHKKNNKKTWKTTTKNNIKCSIFFNKTCYQNNSLPKYTFFNIYIYIYIYEVHTISFQTFSVWGLLVIAHTWNSSPLRNNLLQLKCTCCTVPTTSSRPHGTPLVWACQWPSSKSLSSPQLSHNDNSRWA